MIKQSVYEKVTETIVAQMEQSTGNDWVMPWHRNKDAMGTPYNVVTKKPYRGMNIMLMWGSGRGNQWATYKQWASIGAQVRKGERSVGGVKWLLLEKPGQAGEDPTTRMIPRYFSVFSPDQVDGYTPEPEVELEDETKRVAAAEAAIKRLKVDIREGGDRACFAPELDQVKLPERKRFKATKTSSATANYYSTKLHEVTHWTGHKSRLNRDLTGKFASDAYAFEELVAELGAAFACAHFGISNDPRVDHAQYLKHWLRVMKGDPRAIFTAASMAQKACDLIVGRKPEEAVATGK